MSSAQVLYGFPNRTVLAAYKPGIQAARNGRVIGAFDNGPAIGKERDFIRIAPELQHKRIVLDLAMMSQTAGHLGKVHGTAALMDPHGISSAKRDLRAALTRQMDELMLRARLAFSSRT